MSTSATAFAESGHRAPPAVVPAHGPPKAMGCGGCLRAKLMHPGGVGQKVIDARSESTHASESRPLLPQRSRQKTHGQTRQELLG
jgi:hypothetical protein